jgi:hypothetical protein
MMGDMARIRKLMVAWAVLVLLGGGISVAQSKEPVFRFAPPDGTVYTETVATTQTVERADGRSSGTTSELEIEWRTARTATGCTRTETLTGGSSQSAHQEMDRKVLEAMKGKSVTHLVDADGRLVEVAGTEALVEAIRKALPANVAAAAAKAFTRESVLASARAEWQARVGNYLGRSATPGSAWLATDSYLLPNGELVEHYTAIKVVSAETAAGRQCVRVEYRLGRDPEDFAGFLGEGYSAAVAGKQALPGTVTVSGEGYRLLDPATLLCYGEEVSRAFGNVIMAVQGVGEMPITVRQKKSYRYEYR